jgi:putative glutamine amidotransferase
MKKLRIAMPSRTLGLKNEVPTYAHAPYVPRDIVTILGQLGVIPMVLPDFAEACGEDYVEIFDGLLLPGGADVDPTFFGEEPEWKVGGADYKMDRFEIGVIRAFYKAGKPIFGICRGIQVLNIALGGTVYQDLQTDNPAAYIRHSQGAFGAYPTHHVSVKEGSLLYHALGASAYVNSRHHQSIKKVAPGLTVTAKAPDGVIEGVESIDSDQVAAVQWHPENMWPEHPEMRRLFEDFVDRVRRHAGN